MEDLDKSLKLWMWFITRQMPQFLIDKRIFIIEALLKIFKTCKGG